MNISEWYDLCDEWALGSERNPIKPVVEKICMLGLDITKDTDNITKKMSESKMDIQDVFRDLHNAHKRITRMMGLFEVMFIRCYGPTEKDLETEMIVPKDEDTKTADPEKSEKESNPDDLFREINQLKPEDSEVKKVAEEIIKSKKNPLEEFKTAMKDVMSRINVQDLYKGQVRITPTQVMNFVCEITNVTSYVASALAFAKRYYPNRYGIRLSVLYFVGLVSERVPTRIKKETIKVRN